jgi:hypothetical protein
MKTNSVYKVLSVKFRINSVKRSNLPVNGGIARRHKGVKV